MVHLALAQPPDALARVPCDTEHVATEDQTFGARLRVAVGGRPLRQVARETGIPRTTLQALVKDDTRKRGCYRETVELLAEKLGVSASWLQFGVAA